MEAVGALLTIQDLPEEIIVYILSFLCPSDLSMSVAKVCTTWQDLAYTPSIWRFKDYTCQGDQKLEERSEIFLRVPCLRTLTMAALSCSDPAALLSHLGDRVLPIAELVLSGRRLNSEFYRDVPEHFEGVQKLVLLDVRLRQEDYSALGNLRSMTTVELSSDRVSWTGVQTLLSSCPNVSCLRIGAVVGCDDGDELALIQTLNSMSTKLTHCHLLGPLSISDGALVSLGNCTRLQVLEISDCSGVLGLGPDGIMKLRSLEKLTLINLDQIDPLSLNQVFEGMCLEKLCHLNLAVCANLVDDDIRVIAERCPDLLSLNIRGCDIVSDFGLHYILENCKKLHTLELWGLWRLTERSFNPYLPPNLPQLRHIDLRYCRNVPQELLRKLEMKGRKILW